MTLALIAEFLPYPSRSITVAYEYDYRHEWMEKPWWILVRFGPNEASGRLNQAGLTGIAQAERLLKQLVDLVQNESPVAYTSDPPRFVEEAIARTN